MRKNRGRFFGYIISRIAPTPFDVPNGYVVYTIYGTIVLYDNNNFILISIFFFLPVKHDNSLLQLQTTITTT